MPKRLEVEGVKIPWYYGVGAKLEIKGSGNDLYLGPRASIGLKKLVERETIEVFAEGSAYLDITSETSLNLDVAIGGRFYF
ncbi:MAG: hypothetical protein HOO06_04200 [Bdellovibrionaceae bacterium]|jgi:hypothetical protein|nr:hypothetical protein [Pseudobdellovibrionaceae bacterium]